MADVKELKEEFWNWWNDSKAEYEEVVNYKKTKLEIVQEENLQLKNWLRHLCQAIKTHDEYKTLSDTTSINSIMSFLRK